MRKIICLAAAAAMVFLFACSKQGGEKTSNAAYFAKVGSATITQDDVKRELKNLPEQIQKMFEGPAGTERFVDELVKKEILYQEAKKKGIEKNDEYKKKLEDFKKLSLISILLEKEVEEKAKVTEKDARAYYDTHKSDFASNSQIKASHILVKTPEEAKQIMDQLKKGADFAKLAREKSIDTGSAKNGGDLGYFSKGQMVPEFEKAVLGMKKGEVNGPVKTQYGYHVIKVTDKKEGATMDFDSVKNPLTQKLTAEKQKEVFDAYMAGLKNTYKAEVNKEAIAKAAAAPQGTAPAGTGVEPAPKK